MNNLQIQKYIHLNYFILITLLPICGHFIAANHIQLFLISLMNSLFLRPRLNQLNKK